VPDFRNGCFEMGSQPGLAPVMSTLVVDTSRNALRELVRCLGNGILVVVRAKVEGDKHLAIVHLTDLSLEPDRATPGAHVHEFALLNAQLRGVLLAQLHVVARHRIVQTLRAPGLRARVELKSAEYSLLGQRRRHIHDRRDGR
jgi:hypothetical protein